MYNKRMKKYIHFFFIGVVFVSLTGCVTAPKLDNPYEVPSPDIVARKYSLICENCAGASVSPYFTPAQQTGHYKLQMNYTFELSKPLANKIWGIASAFTLFTVPFQSATGHWTATAQLWNMRTGEVAELVPAKKANNAVWVAWWMFPAVSSLSEPFMDDDGNPASPDAQRLLAETFVKEAALVVYQPQLSYAKWQCTSYRCKYNRLLAKKSATADEVVWVAQNTDDFNEFQTVRSFLLGKMSTAQNCATTQGLILDKKLVAKNTGMYWKMVDFYKAYCPATSKGYGLTREELLERKGRPTWQYQANERTEELSFTDMTSGAQTTIYTLDHGIVTGIR